MVCVEIRVSFRNLRPTGQVDIHIPRWNAHESVAIWRTQSFDIVFAFEQKANIAADGLDTRLDHCRSAQMSPD